MTKENFAIGAFITACLACPVAGVWLAYTTGNSWWMWLCLPIVIFLS